jgi:hypothetical protein
MKHYLKNLLHFEKRFALDKNGKIIEEKVIKREFEMHDLG